jgi:hypothetical protein
LKATLYYRWHRIFSLPPANPYRCLIGGWGYFFFLFKGQRYEVLQIYRYFCRSVFIKR